MSIHSMMTSFDLKHLYLLLEDSSMSPKVSLQPVSTPVVRHASWSPLPPNSSYHCILTVLTNLGSLNLYQRNKKKLSLSDIWADKCKAGWEVVDPTVLSMNEALRILRERAYKIKISAFEWNRKQGELILFTGNMDGTVVMWNIIPNGDNLVAEIINTFPSDLERVCCLAPLRLQDDSYYLLVCGISGKIQCFQILEGHELNKLMIWNDSDRLEVPSGGAVGEILDEGLIFVVTKGSHFLFFWLDHDCNLLNFSVFNSENISITGLTWTAPGKYLATSRSGDFFSINVDLSSYRLDIQVEKFQSSLRNNSFSCHGLCSSKNSVIIVAAYSVCSAYDHLILKEPTHILLCYDPELLNPHVFLQKETTNLFDDWDFLEMIRYECCTKKEAISFMDEATEISSDDIIKLKKFYWFNLFCSVSNDDLNMTTSTATITTVTTTNSTDDNTAETQIRFGQELKVLIISRSLTENLEVLLNKSDLTTVELQRLSVASKWLEYVLKLLGPNYSRDKMYFSDLLHKLSKFVQETTEVCLFCSNDVKEMSTDLFMVCSSGHKIPRCMKTLLPIADPDYYSCHVCGEVANIESTNNSTCTMCDAPLKSIQDILFNKLLP